MENAEYQNHDSHVSNCWRVLPSAFDHVSLTIDRSPATVTSIASYPWLLLPFTLSQS